MWGSESEQTAFGTLYPLWYGPTGLRDRKKAIKSIQQLADRGYTPSVFMLGLACFDGEGIKRDYRNAFDLYRIAAEAEYPSAEGGYGNFFIMASPEHGACAYDPAEAARWHLRASKHGNAGSQFNLAFSYWDGRGVDRGPIEAYIWASASVHCSAIRTRPAENLRNQAAAVLDSTERTGANERIAALCETLPLPWSEHLGYWRVLGAQAGVCDTSGNMKS